jgi:hypothetical protein
LGQHDLPASVLFCENAKKAIFAAKWSTLIISIHGYMLGQDGHVAISVKLNVRFTRVKYLERSVGPLQILKLLFFVQQFALRIESEEIIRQYFAQEFRIPILFRVYITVSERDDFLNGLVVLGHRRLALSEQWHRQERPECRDTSNFHDALSFLRAVRAAELHTNIWIFPPRADRD